MIYQNSGEVAEESVQVARDTEQRPIFRPVRVCVCVFIGECRAEFINKIKRIAWKCRKSDFRSQCFGQPEHQAVSVG